MSDRPLSEKLALLAEYVGELVDGNPVEGSTVQVAAEIVAALVSTIGSCADDAALMERVLRASGLAAVVPAPTPVVRSVQIIPIEARS